MSSTTIRYSGVPENSHSRDISSDLSADSAAYTDITVRFRAAIESERKTWTGAQTETATPVPDPEPESDPDPDVPGAYRYRVDPDSCDLSAPPSDPRSPYYEPSHLRHQPGDTWVIE